MACEHERQYLNHIISNNPYEYYWKCKKCGRMLSDTFRPTIFKPTESDLDLVKWSWKRKEAGYKHQTKLA